MGRGGGGYGNGTSGKCSFDVAYLAFFLTGSVCIHYLNHSMISFKTKVQSAFAFQSFI